MLQKLEAALTTPPSRYGDVGRLHCYYLGTYHAKPLPRVGVLNTRPTPTINNWEQSSRLATLLSAAVDRSDLREEILLLPYDLKGYPPLW